MRFKTTKTQSRRMRLALFGAAGLTVVLLTVRHYYEASTLNTLREYSQSTVQVLAILNNSIELTLDLKPTAEGLQSDVLLPDSASRAIFEQAHFVRTTSALRPLLDSLVKLNEHSVRLRPLALRLRSEAEPILRADTSIPPAALAPLVQRLTRSLRVFRMALGDEHLADQQRIHQKISTVRTFDAIIDGMALGLAAILLYIFYAYTLRRDRLTASMLERQKELTQYLEAIPEGVTVLNTDWQIVYMNQAGMRMLNAGAEGVPVRITAVLARLRMSYADTAQPYQPQDLPLSRALRGETYSTDNILVYPHGEPRVLATHARPLYDREGDIIGAIASFRDITEAKQQEEDMRQAKAVAEQSLHDREVFVSNISHDIRTPLNAILGFTDILKENPHTPDVRLYIDDIQSSGYNLLALINDLLDISELEAGRLRLEPVPRRIEEIVATVKNDMALRAKERGIDHAVRIEGSLPGRVLVDPLRLTQVLLRLSSQIIRMVGQGQISMLVQAQPQPDKPQYTTLRFTLEASGFYVAPDQLDALFDRYGRIPDDTRYRSSGTGLGLNIAKDLIELMGGYIDAQSDPKWGVRFTVTLPCPLADDPAGANGTGASAQNGPPKLLLVEDNILNQKVMQNFLQRYGVQPAVANNGVEALALLRRQSFDLIFMDIQMPEMDGYTTTREIRQTLKLQTPIVAMTAYTMAGERERCLEVGMNAFIPKPVRMQQLDDALAVFVPTLRPLTDESSEETSNNGIVDETFLNEITGGDADFLQEMFSAFEEELPVYRRSLHDALATHDRETFNRVAHKFCSSLNALAMIDTAKKMRQMEKDATLEIAELQRAVGEVFMEIDQGVRFLRVLTNKVQNGSAVGK